MSRAAAPSAAPPVAAAWDRFERSVAAESAASSLAYGLCWDHDHRDAFPALQESRARERRSSARRVGLPDRRDGGPRRRVADPVPGGGVMILAPRPARPSDEKLIAVAARHLVPGHVVVDPTGERTVAEVFAPRHIAAYRGDAVAVWFEGANGSKRGSFTRYQADLPVSVKA